MMKFDKQDTNIAKTAAIIMMYIHHLFFSADSYRGYDVVFAPLNESQTLALAQICKVCVAIFVFLSAYGITVSFQQNEKEKGCSLKELCFDDFCRYIKLLSGFLVIYIVAQIFSFLGRSNIEVYGTGTKRVLFTLIDALGVASVFGTPTFNPTWWYMGLAITLLLIMPFLYKAYEKIGVTMIFMTVILPRMLALEFTSLHWYLLTMCMGILFAKENLFVKLHNAHRWKWDGIGKLFLAVVLLIMCAWMRYKTELLLDVFDAVIAALIIYISFELFDNLSES